LRIHLYRTPHAPPFVDRPYAMARHIVERLSYRGLAKNATRSFVALGLANIYLVGPEQPVFSETPSRQVSAAVTCGSTATRRTGQQ
jgi:hypothetical protein